MENFNISDSPERKQKLYLKEQIYQLVFQKYKHQKIDVAGRIAKELGISLLQAEMLVIRMKEDKKEG